MNNNEIDTEYKNRLVEYRRHLHRHPELSFREVNTMKWIRDCLTQMDIPILSGITGNSTVAVLKGTAPGPVLLFRADIDALPIKEETGLEYASEVDGVMHACGHDAHTATLLCFADYMSKHREMIKGTVKFVFQQGEEQTPGGGKIIVSDGVLDDVDYGFAWHCAPECDTGTVIVSGGPRTAAFGNFEICVKGRGGHGGFPFRAVDAVSTCALIADSLNQLINWTVDPLKSATLIISHISAGQHGVYNIIPGEAKIEGNIRCLDNATSEMLFKRVKEIAENICAAKECRCEFKYHEGYPALVNDIEASKRIRNALNKNGINAIEAKPIMGAEDFAFYLQKIPGVYMNVGIHNPADDNTKFPPHNPHFCIDENAMVVALKSLIVVYEEFIKQ